MNDRLEKEDPVRLLPSMKQLCNQTDFKNKAKLEILEKADTDQTRYAKCNLFVELKSF